MHLLLQNISKTMHCALDVHLMHDACMVFSDICMIMWLLDSNANGTLPILAGVRCVHSCFIMSSTCMLLDLSDTLSHLNTILVAVPLLFVWWSECYVCTFLVCSFMFFCLNSVISALFDAIAWWWAERNKIPSKQTSLRYNFTEVLRSWYGYAH